MRCARFLLPILIVIGGASASAGTKAGVTLPDTVTIANHQLTLNGMGLREATILKVDVYVAGLYLEHRSSNPAQIIASDEPKVIVLRFVRDVDRKDIVKAWTEGFTHNATVPLAQIQPMVDQLNAWMPAFHKGDTVAFTYLPGGTVTVDVNGVRKGSINNADFARSLFAIWLGAKPPTSDLKRGMLGG